MILIKELTANKIPGSTSLFIQFDYRPEIVEAIKVNTTVRNYDSKNKIWEVPTSDLHTLLDKLCVLDDNILLNTLPDQSKKEFKRFDIGPFKTELFDHQRDAIQYGLNNPNFLLLDEPGLGKTILTLYLAEERKKLFNIEHCLIVCGVNTLKSNWKKEIQKHSNFTGHILGERLNKKGKVVFGGIKERLDDLKNPIDDFYIITNIESLRDDKIVKALNSGPNKIDMVVLDEFHHVKNPSALLTKGFLKIKSQYKLGLTGTLITNSPLDSYTSLKWLGIENSTYTNFKFYYCNFTGPFNNILVGYRNMDVLKNLLDTCSLRRTKDLLNLPEKNIIVEEVEMNDDQANFYSNIVNGVVELIDKVELSTGNLLAMTARLRQATACPSMLTTEEISSAKIDRCCDLAELIVSNGDKVVIFSVFKETIKVISNKLKDYNPLICTGDIKDDIISLNIDLFLTNDNYKILICTTAKLGTGVTLTSASYEIFIDTPFTAADFLLCQDRIHRIGAKKPVFIYNLITKDTIDEHVKDIVDDKAMLSEYIIDNKCSPNLKRRLLKIITDLKTS